MSTLRSILLIVVAVSAVTARAQIGIGALADKTIYTDRASFTITNEVGYAYDARLDGNPVPVGTSVTVANADYHELSVVRTNTTTLAISSRLVRFIIRSSERGNTEDGLPPWTPYPLIPSARGEFGGARLRIISPGRFPHGMPIPVVAWVEDGAGHAVRVNGEVVFPGQASIRLVRGVGSGFLAATNPPGLIPYGPSVGGLTASKTITVEVGTTWAAVGGTLSGSINWPAGSRIAITNHLLLPAGSTLTIGAGTVVRVNPGIDITNEAQVIINGTVDEPVVFLPVNPGQPWGGFTMRTGSGSISGTGVIFTGSGAAASWFGSGGNPGSHRTEQALFFVGATSGGINSVSLADSAAIYLAGQLGHAVDGGTFTFTRFLMQQTMTGGEYSGATRPLRFTVNDSAFIECPDDTATYANGDNDALYTVHGTHGFTNTLFGFTKDDGIDCGDTGAGVLNIENCWFESSFHEGTALSGTGKRVNHLHNVLLNCGQPVEVGYDAPTAHVERCLILSSQTGARFADNYDWTYGGFLRATNNIILHNYRNVWGMNWADWTYRSAQMDVHSNLLGLPDPRWPNNAAWDPVADAARLGEYFNGPADSPVGIGFALRTNRLDPAALTNGIPVRLSRFSMNVVTVNYVVQSSTAMLCSGTLTFQPGETLKKLVVTISDPQEPEIIHVSLRDASSGEITGLDHLLAVVAPPTTRTLIPQGAIWHFLDTGLDLGSAWTGLSFVETNWSNGAAELGYGDGDEATIVSYGSSTTNRHTTTYFRHTVVVPDPAALAALTAQLKRDDGGVVYLNGTEVFRSNLPDGPINYLTLATNATDDGTVFWPKSVSAGLLVPGTNVVAVEIHQTSLTSSDLSFDLILTADLVPVPERVKHARFGGQWLLFWGDAAYKLEEAASPAGTWTAVVTAGTIYPLNPESPQRFFRLIR